jgi:FMN phosphatase YigB (HAD superfamily)
MFLDPTFWIFLYEAKKSVVITDDFIDAVIVRYPFLKKHSHTLFSIINDFSVNQNVLDLIDTLRMQGYKNIIASNITDRSWRITERKHPELHNHFDGIFTVDTQKITGVFYTRSGKPHKDYYIALREYSKYEGYGYDVPIIFIDDRQSNIDGAHRAQVGIQGIIFRGVDRLKHMLAPWL